MRTLGARGEAVAILLSMIIHNSLLDCHSKRISFLSGLEQGGGLPRDCFCFVVEDVEELIPLVRDDVINEKKDEGCILLPFSRVEYNRALDGAPGCGTYRGGPGEADMNQLYPLDILFMHLVAPSYSSVYGFWLLQGLNDDDGGWGYK
ncbi:hypothetical protein V8C34DRAFT_111966 [Trichoderma compactum]